MRLTKTNVKEIKRNGNSLDRYVCDYILDEWDNYDDKANIFEDVLRYRLLSLFVLPARSATNRSRSEPQWFGFVAFMPLYSVFPSLPSPCAGFGVRRGKTHRNGELLQTEAALRFLILVKILTGILKHCNRTLLQKLCHGATCGSERSSVKRQMSGVRVVPFFFTGRVPELVFVCP